MTHLDPEASFLGLKFSTLLAGFVGGLVSLSFLKDLTRFQAILAVFTGIASAGYLTPALQLWIQVGPELENAVAFVIGLCGMNIIPGLLFVSERFRANPVSFLKGKGD